MHIYIYICIYMCVSHCYSTICTAQPATPSIYVHSCPYFDPAPHCRYLINFFFFFSFLFFFLTPLFNTSSRKNYVTINSLALSLSLSLSLSLDQQLSRQSSRLFLFFVFTLSFNDYYIINYKANISSMQQRVLVTNKCYDGRAQSELV